MPPQSLARLPANPAGIFDRLAVEHGLETGEESQLDEADPDGDSPGPEIRTSEEHVTITGSVHAECSIALHMLKAGRRWGTIEIGTSKGSCWYCIEYLKLLQDKFGVPLPVTDSDGKARAGWTLPDTTPEIAEIHEKLEEKLEEELESIAEWWHQADVLGKRKKK